MTTATGHGREERREVPDEIDAHAQVDFLYATAVDTVMEAAESRRLPYPRGASDVVLLHRSTLVDAGSRLITTSLLEALKTRQVELGRELSGVEQEEVETAINAAIAADVVEYDRARARFNVLHELAELVMYVSIYRQIGQADRMPIDQFTARKRKLQIYCRNRKLGQDWESFACDQIPGEQLDPEDIEGYSNAAYELESDTEARGEKIVGLAATMREIVRDHGLSVESYGGECAFLELAEAYLRGNEGNQPDAGAEARAINWTAAARDVLQKYSITISDAWLPIVNGQFELRD